MNIFEGARRVAKVFAGIAIIGTIIAAILDEPYVQHYYAYDEKAQLQSIDGCYGSSNRFYAKVEQRPELNVTVCGYTDGPEYVQLSNVELSRIDGAQSAKRAEDTGYKLGVLAAILAIGWACVWAIGWIVRGFMGIPRGADSKINSQTREA